MMASAWRAERKRSRAIMVYVDYANVSRDWEERLFQPRMAAAERFSKREYR